MQMHETGQVKEAHSQQEANQLLAKGWTLLTVVVVSSQHQPDALITCYVLGQKANAG